MKDVIITANDAGQRLDRFLKKYLCNAPLSMIYKAVRKDVKVNGKRVKEDTPLCEGDVLSIYIMDAELEKLTKKKRSHSAKRQFTIIYEDENLIAVTKPFGLLVHGDKSEKKDTLANQVTDYLIETGSYVPRAEKSFTPSPVHRLDRNTTGLVIFGKNAESLRILSAMFAEDGYIEKYYYTVVCGELKKPLHLKNKLLKDEERNKVRILPEGAAEGKYIETIAEPITSAGGYSLVKVLLVTGRSHQIRAHLKHAGYPVIGDAKYGDRAKNAQLERRYGLTTQLLHAGMLRFTNAPAPLDYLTGKELKAPLPENLIEITEDLFGSKITENL